MEIKLIWNPDVPKIDPWTAKQMRALAGGHVPESITETYEAIYYDTDDHALINRGIAYRTRHEGEKWIATMKQDEVSRAGFFQRREVNENVEGPEPRPDLFPELCLKASDLKPIVITQFKRTVWVINMPKGTSIEMALDQGYIEAGSKRIPIREIELELKTGRIGDLMHVASVLSRHCGLIVERESKFERGIQLAGIASGMNSVATHPAQIQTHKEDKCIGYFQEQIMDALQKQSRLLADPKQVGRLRSFRIQIRRLRSLLTFWEGYIHLKNEKRHSKSLRRWFQLLGEVREVDVLLEILQNEQDETILCRRLKVRQKNLRRQLVSCLWEGELTAVLFEMWGRLLSEKICDNGKQLSEEQYCKDNLLQYAKQIRQNLKRLPRMMNDEGKLHNLRIRLKKIRYVFEAMPSSPYFDFALLDQIKKAQSILGRIQDAEETIRLLKEWGVGSDKTIRRLVSEKEAAKAELPTAAASMLDILNGYVK